MNASNMYVLPRAVLLHRRLLVTILARGSQSDAAAVQKGHRSCVGIYCTRGRGSDLTVATVRGFRVRRDEVNLCNGDVTGITKFSCSIDK